MRDSVIRKIKEERLVVIVRGVAKDQLIPFAEAMYAGGVRLMEITFDATGKTPDSETASAIEMLVRHFEGKMLIGAGTVLSAEQVELTAKAGGKFIISPDTDIAVIEKTRELGLVSMPGALTPSECKQAHAHGADFVKLFPIDSLGVSYLRAVSAPLSHIPFIAVGGVTLDNIKDFLAAGAVGFGIGSAIVNKKLIAEGNFAAITDTARAYVNAAKGE